jgi:hypothetical protein
MDRHHIAHYSLAACFAAALAYGAYELRHVATDSDFPVYRVSDFALDGVQIGPDDVVVIYATPDSGRASLVIKKAIELTGAKVQVETDLSHHEGIWIAPADARSLMVSDALARATGARIKVADFPEGKDAYGATLQIGVGTPERN